MIKFLRSREGTWLLFLLPAVIILALIALFPFFYSLVISFTGMNISKPQLGVPFVGVNNYIGLFNSGRFLGTVRITFIYVFSALTLEFFLGFGLASLLREYFIGRKIIVAFLIFPMVIPPIVSGLIWRFMLNADTGIINFLLEQVGIGYFSWLGNPNLALPSIVLVDVWQWTPFFMLVILAGYASLPKEPFEAAKVDGASSWQEFRYITLPLLKNVILIGFLIRTIRLFRNFAPIYSMTRGGPGTATETMIIHGYKLGFQFFNTGEAAALAIVMLIMVIVVCLSYVKITQRQGVAT